MEVYIKENAFIAKLAATILKTERMAVTINNKIYLYNCSKEDFLRNKKWVCHEIVHILQYKRMGPLNFITAYLLQCIIKGYTKNKFEKEAREKKHYVALMERINFI
jgi:hypothetical protein